MLDGLDVSGRKVLVIGMGGAGDVVGATPTALMLRRLGAKVTLGGITWERFVIDPRPGPRRVDEIEGAKRLTRYAAYVDGECRIAGGAHLQVARAAGVLGERLIALDVSGGAIGVSETIDELSDTIGIDMIIGVDAGGDVLATGGESGLRSPLADSVMLAAIARSSIDSIIGVIGIGCDGELSAEEACARLSELASVGALLGAVGISRADLAVMRRLIGSVFTEVGRMIVFSAEGFRGEVPIRDGTRRATPSILATITFYLDTSKLYESSKLAKAVSASMSIDEASKALNKLGLMTELDLEREAKRIGARSYRELASNLGTKI